MTKEFAEPATAAPEIAANLYAEKRNIFQRMQPTRQDVATLHGVVTALADGAKGPARGATLTPDGAEALRNFLQLLGYPVAESLGFREVLDALRPYYEAFLANAAAWNASARGSSRSGALRAIRRGVGLAGMWYRFGKSGYLILSLHLHGLRLFALHGGTDPYLYLFCCRLTDNYPVFLSNIQLNRFIELKTGCLSCFRSDDPIHG